MIQRWLERLWYRPRVWDAPIWLLFSPLLLLYCLLITLRRAGYRSGLLRVVESPVPLLVVGNLTVGGSGKTPLVIALVEWARRAGYCPAVVSRGYGREDESLLLKVEAKTDPRHSGDEPLLIATSTGVAVFVAAERSRAVAAAVAEGADLVISDDGLQHYPMGRDLELLVVDAERRFGNRICLPLGPLREPLSRLQQVDAVVFQGDVEEVLHFTLQPLPLYRLGLQSETMPLEQLSGQPVHAVAGLGNPGRFFASLRQAGVAVVEHPFADHHQYNETDFMAWEGVVVMTEKDAVKCAGLDFPEACTVWVAPVVAVMSRELEALLARRMAR